MIHLVFPLLFLFVLVYTHVSVGVFTRTPFFDLISSCVFNFSTEGTLGNAWLYFPGSKVGQIITIFPFINHFVALISVHPPRLLCHCVMQIFQLPLAVYEN
jgi:hypothetical protein